MAGILIVDDNEDILVASRIILKKHFTNIYTASNPHEIESILAEKTIQVVLLDMNFTTGFTSGKEGLRWLKKIKKYDQRIAVVLMTAYGDIALAVRAMQEGAFDFIIKPWENEQLLDILQRAIAPKAETQATAVTKPPTQQSGSGIVGNSPAMQEVFTLIDKVGPTVANVLVLGENGTGKELVARALHAASPRANGPFVQVDLGAVSENLFESELFGHVKGAFTDARNDRTGRMEAAQGGTLFLDEIGNLPLPLQAKLLSALQNRAIIPLGSNKPRNIDIRLICATNATLHQCVQEGTFRQDLLYRINTVEISLPPLRSRGHDIALLAQFFLNQYAEKYQKGAISLHQQALSKLEAHSWPGNVRELQHALERAVIMADSVVIGADDIRLSQGHTTLLPEADRQALNLEDVEKRAIEDAIRQHGGNLSSAAKALGLGRTTLYRKIAKYGLDA
ncbi:MAG: sigma-54-dependent transcriptional regulator [Bacteroidia bacterium]